MLWCISSLSPPASSCAPYFLPYFIQYFPLLLYADLSDILGSSSHTLCFLFSLSLSLSTACCSKYANMCYSSPWLDVLLIKSLRSASECEEIACDFPSHNPDSASPQPLGETLYVGGQKNAALAPCPGVILRLLILMSLKNAFSQLQMCTVKRALHQWVNTS